MVEVKLSFNWFLIIGLLLVSLAGPVMALDYSGDMAYVSPLTSETYTVGAGGLSSAGYLRSFEIINVANYTNLQYISYTVVNTSVSHDAGGSYAANVNIYVGANYVGSGSLGYYESPGWGTTTVYLSMFDFDASGITGHYEFNFTGDAIFQANGLNKLILLAKNGGSAPGQVAFHRYAIPTTDYQAPGIYVIYSGYSFFNRWSMVESGVATVTVDVLKTGNMSQIYVYQTDSTLINTDGNINTVDYIISTILKPLKIAFKDSRGMFHNTSYMYAGETGYSIALDATNITPTGYTYGTLSSESDITLNTVTDIAWEWSDATGDHNFENVVGTGNITSYTKKGTTWWGWNLSANDYTVNKGTTIPNPVTLSGSGVSTGIKTIKCIVYTSDGNYYVLTTSLTVGGANQYTTTYAAAIDYSTGAYIDDATVAFQNVATSAWYSNVTTGGQNQIYSPPGIYLNIVATAPGYGTITRSAVTASQLNQTPMYYELGMFPVTNITGSAYTTFYVSVTDKESGQAIDMASVFVYNTSFQWYHNTGTNGIATFSVYNQTLYRVTASKSGYNSLSKYVTVLSGTVATTDIELSHFPIAVTTTAFPTVAIPTTPIPGYTPGTGAGGGGGNFTGFWAPFQNAAIAMGATPSSVGILVAMFLTFCGLIVGFSVGGIPGGEMGGILGLIFSVAFGFFPLAIAIVTVVGLIAYVSLRFWGMTH